METEKGSAIYFTFIVMSIMLAMALGISVLLIGQVKSIKGIEDSVKAFYAADSGIERVVYEDKLCRQTRCGFLSWNCVDEINCDEGLLYEGDVFGTLSDVNVSYLVKFANGLFPAQSTGTYSGTKRAVEIVGCGCSVTFTYNGASVTYGTVSHNGECWLDRNLGATQVATRSTDYLAYGDLFQWGRPADGHQLITWTNSTTGDGTNGTQTPAVATTTPGTNTFIIPSSDWSSIDSNGAIRSAYLAKTDGTGICPAGFRVPTEAELIAEQVSWRSNNSAGAFDSPLKLTVAGVRDNGDGSLFSVGSSGHYWSSTVNGANSRNLHFNSGNAGVNSNYRAYGLTVRCLKD